MLKVGLTGGLATGKSYVSARLAELGCHVIQADKLGHEVLRRGGEAFEDVITEFGAGILGADGEIDRKALGAIVFPAPERLAKLNSLVHPHVFHRQEEFFEQTARADPDGIAVAEAAIMIESGSYKRYDRLILVVCPEQMQIQRFVQRGGTETEAIDRLARQLPLDEKRKFADFVIDTSGTFEETDTQVQDVYRNLKQETR
jgi:dephospho-CoA kinase